MLWKEGCYGRVEQRLDLRHNWLYFIESCVFYWQAHLEEALGRDPEVLNCKIGGYSTLGGWFSRSHIPSLCLHSWWVITSHCCKVQWDLTTRGVIITFITNIPQTVFSITSAAASEAWSSSWTGHKNYPATAITAYLPVQPGFLGIWMGKNGLGLSDTQVSWDHVWGRHMLNKDHQCHVWFP